MNFSMEEFIEEVRVRPAIYDITLPEYSDRGYKTSLWVEICQLFTQNWSDLDGDSKDAVCKEMKNRWKSIRDAFVREVRYLKEAEVNGEPPVKKRKYIYYDHLLFLLPTVGARSMRGNQHSNSLLDYLTIKEECNGEDGCHNDHSFEQNENEDENNVKKSRKSYKKIINALKRKNNDLLNSGTLTIRLKQNKNEEKTWNYSVSNPGDTQQSLNDTENEAEEKVQVTPAIEDIIMPDHQRGEPPDYDVSNGYMDGYRPDSDYMFLMSLLPSFKKLGEERKSFIKIEIASLIHESLYGTNTNNHNISSSSNSNNTNNSTNNISNTNNNKQT